jgi:hypothetical protein
MGAGGGWHRDDLDRRDGCILGTNFRSDRRPRLFYDEIAEMWFDVANRTWFDVANRTTLPLARWLPQALHLLWKEGASVVINFTIRDLATDLGDIGPQVGPGRSGIFYADGHPKPAYTAFRFPFVTERLDKRTLRAWGKAPAGGNLVIQRRQRGGWISAKKLKVGRGAVFTAKLSLRGKQRLRAAVAGNQSMVWKQG